MLEPNTVKAGDELIYEFGNRVKQRKIVKVRRVDTEGVIILENNSRFTPDGIAFGFSQFNTNELHPLPLARG